MALANVTNVNVRCQPLSAGSFTIGGNIAGAVGNVTLGMNDGQSLTQSNGAFTFPVAVATGTTYAVRVITAPANQTCTVTNPSGTATANVTNVTVTCSTNGGATGPFTLGGNITGYTTAGLVIKLNDDQTVTPVPNAASYVFATPIANGTPYVVTVLNQPVA